MAEVVEVLVSLDRRWRVEVRSDGRCQLFERGFCARAAQRAELAQRLADFVVTLADLRKG